MLRICDKKGCLHAYVSDVPSRRHCDECLLKSYRSNFRTSLNHVALLPDAALRLRCLSEMKAAVQSKLNGELKP
jgi:hypothetical protein